MRKTAKMTTEEFFPPGYDRKTEIILIASGFAFSTLYALVRFFLIFGDAEKSLYLPGNAAKLRPDAVMPDFEILFQGCLGGFVIMFCSAAVLAAAHYSYHFRGSKSIYLMRRLPHRGELAKRCLAVPLLTAAAAAAAAALITLLCLKFYLYLVPAQALAPDQWHKFLT